MENLQYDLFEKYDDTSLLLQEITSLRNAQGKLRRKLFAELGDLQDKYDELKQNYDKLLFRTSHLE